MGVLERTPQEDAKMDARNRLVNDIYNAALPYDGIAIGAAGMTADEIQQVLDRTMGHLRRHLEARDKPCSPAAPS